MRALTWPPPVRSWMTSGIPDPRSRASGTPGNRPASPAASSRLCYRLVPPAPAPRPDDRGASLPRGSVLDLDLDLVDLNLDLGFVSPLPGKPGKPGKVMGAPQSLMRPSYPDDRVSTRDAEYRKLASAAPTALWWPPTSASGPDGTPGAMESRQRGGTRVPRCSRRQDRPWACPTNSVLGSDILRLQPGPAPGIRTVEHLDIDRVPVDRHDPDPLAGGG